MTRYLLTFLFIALTAIPAFAKGEQCGMECAGCHSLTVDEANTLMKDIGSVKSVKLSEVGGLFEMLVENGGRQAIAYLDFAKKHLVTGVFSLATRKPIAEPPARKIDIGSIPLDNSLVMGNPKGSKKLIVFTDPECPFCGKLHAELHKLVKTEPELVVYIKLFPLPMHPKAYDKARVILAKKSLPLLDIAFTGGQVPEATAQDPKEPIDEIKKLAASLGINSTPTIIFADGRIVPGAVDADSLKKMLEGDKKDDKSEQKEQKEQRPVEKAPKKHDKPKDK